MSTTLLARIKSDRKNLPELPTPSVPRKLCFENYDKEGTKCMNEKSVEAKKGRGVSTRLGAEGVRECVAEAIVKFDKCTGMNRRAGTVRDPPLEVARVGIAVKESSWKSPQYVHLIHFPYGS